MKRALLVLTIAALALPTAAVAKGPEAAVVNGPGDGGGINFGGGGGPPDSGPLGALADQAGLYPAVFSQQPDPMLKSRPKGDLGPKYTITWTVPGPNNETWLLHQDVYPYASPAPVTYMAPGQPVYSETTVGGWYQASPALKETLVDAGLPSSASAAAGSSGDSAFPTALVSVLTAFLLVAMATALLIRRRTRPAATA